MNGPRADGPWIVFALRRESKPFRRLLGRGTPFACADFPVHFYASEAGRLVLIEPGVGERVETALAELFCVPELECPPLVLLAGFSGALDGSLEVGEVVLGTEVVDDQGRLRPLRANFTDDDARTRWRRGRLLTTAGLVCSPQQKQELCKRFQALAVDMETAGAANICWAHEVPFASVRVISDSCRTPLSPELISCLVGGRVSWRRLTGALLQRPRFAAEMWALARATRLAACRLAETLKLLVSAPTNR